MSLSESFHLVIAAERLISLVCGCLSDIKVPFCDCVLPFVVFSDDDFDMSRYSSSGYSSAEVRCLNYQVLMQ